MLKPMILAILDLMIFTKKTSYKKGVQNYIYSEKFENISLYNLFDHLLSHIDVTIGVVNEFVILRTQF